MSRVDIDNKLARDQVRKLIGPILREGRFSISKHAREQMAKRNLIDNDVINVLRCGNIHDEGELEKGSWRYRVETGRMIVVVAFRSTEALVVVSAWRK